LQRLVHLVVGNASNDAVLAALLAAADQLSAAFADPDTGVVVIERRLALIWARSWFLECSSPPGGCSWAARLRVGLAR
jgi:hypothetical protein